MFNFNKSPETIIYDYKQMLIDIDIFNQYFIKYYEKISPENRSKKENSPEFIKESIIKQILDKKIFINMSVRDDYNYHDKKEYNIANNLPKLVSVSYIEEYIELLYNSFISYCSNNKELTKEEYTAFINSYFGFISYKQKMLSEKSIQHAYFDNIYIVKPFFKIKSISEDLINTNLNELEKKKERDGADALDLEINKITTQFTKENLIPNYSPELITAFSYHSSDVIDSLNTEYIFNSKDAVSEDRLDQSRLLSNRFYPVFEYPVKIKEKKTNKEREIKKAVIVTTFEALLTRFKGEKDGKLKIFGNFINKYDSEDMYKEFHFLQNSDFEKFVLGMESNKIFFDRINGVINRGDEDNDSELSLIDGEAMKEFNATMINAVLNKYTDIYFKIFKNEGLIVGRDNSDILEPLKTISKERKDQIITMLMGLGKVDSSKMSIDQDGQIKKFQIHEISTNKKFLVDLRLGFTAVSEQSGSTPDVFIRLSNIKEIGGKMKERAPLSSWGYKEENLKIIKNLAKNNSTGLILVTGPTGSGKSTLQYGIIYEELINRPEIHMLTAEDPIEQDIGLFNVDQRLINEKMTGARHLKSFLREDPNWILIGETRDKELYDLLVEASLTGHLGWSTMHTNGASATIERMIGLFAGGNPMAYELGKSVAFSVLKGVISQLLIPKLCPCCKEKTDASSVRSRLLEKNYTKEEIDEMIEDKGSFYKRKISSGETKCENCKGSGLKGKQVINEIMDLTVPEIMKGAKAGDFSKIVTLFKDGMSYVNNGEIDVDILSKVVSKPID